MDDTKQSGETLETVTSNNCAITSSNSNLIQTNDAPKKEEMTDKKNNKCTSQSFIKGCFEFMCCCGTVCKCYEPGTYVKQTLAKEPECWICCENTCGEKPFCACDCCNENFNERHSNMVKENYNSCCHCTCCEHNYLSCSHCRLCGMEPGMSEKRLVSDNANYLINCGNHICCSTRKECGQRDPYACKVCFINIYNFHGRNNGYTCCNICRICADGYKKLKS